jgi:putative transposase
MKRIRLEPSAYQQGHCFSVAIGTAHRIRHFKKPDTVRLCLDALSESAERYHASVFAYCFMPEHLHLLVAMAPGVDLVQFVRQFKQLSAYRFRRQSSHARLWQARFYDHALRSDENLSGVARYIWENPVRAGLAESAAEYPYSGCLVWDETGERETARV